MSKSSIEIDGLWMRTKPGCPLGTVQVLIRHEGVWKVAFGGDNDPAPQAHAIDQMVDHCIHPLGLQRVIGGPGLPPPEFGEHRSLRTSRQRRRR